MAVWLTANVTETDVNIEANTSKVTVQLYANWNYGSWNALAPNGSLSIDGTEYPFESSFNEGRAWTGSQLIATKSKTVAHEADGSKNVHLSAWFDTQVSSGTITWSVWRDLTTIPRASQPSLQDSSPTMGDTIAIYTNPASDTFTHTLRYSFNGREGTIAEDVKASAYWEVTLNLALAIPNATSGAGTITCETYSADGTLIGTKSTTFTATVPDTVVPTIGTVAVSETTSGVAEKFDGYLVQNKSAVKVSVEAEGAWGSTIASVRSTLDGATYAGASWTSSTLRGYGTLPLEVTVTDSRGRKATKSLGLVALAYSAPSIVAFAPYRSTADGTPDEEGTYLTVQRAWDVQALEGLNDVEVLVEYRRKGEEAWEQFEANTTDYSGDGTVTSAAALLSVDYGYEVRMTVSDWFDSTPATFALQTAFTLLDYRKTGRGISFGKVSELDAFECALPARFTGGFVGAEDRGPALNTPWGALGGAYKAASYALDPTGWVRLSGVLRGSGASSEGTVLFTLPEGFRPEYAERFPVVTAGGFAALDVLPSGAVALAHGAVGAFLSLSGVAFRAAITASADEEV